MHEFLASLASSAALDLAETATELIDLDDLYEPGTEAPRAYQQTNYGAEEASSEGGSEGGSEGDEDAECEDNQDI
ncbi:hypothetical protein MY10362_006994 [Beauveria mimosiformis]